MAAQTDLSTYFKKRNFKKTAEPRGKVHAKSKKHRFVVQRHEASKLHYDFRLELAGVLKSWAVPKEPTPDPKQKRLAVEVEDHPVEYATFEGDIPEGEYGAGHVDIWDTGEWKPLDRDPLEAYEKGKLSFELKGTRLKGRWNLIRTNGMRSRDSKKNWLLLKAKDEFAESSSETSGSSVKTTAKRANKSSEKRTKKKAKPLGFVEPQLATLVDEVPHGSNWIFESKYDGYRLLAAAGTKKVRLLTRYGNDWSERFSFIAEAIKELKVKSALIDGEVVALNEKGISDFQALQNSLVDKEKSKKLSYYAFDLLELDGEDLRELPLYERKRLLERIIKESESDRIKFSGHSVGNGEELFARSCAEEREGIICKRIDGPYSSGRRGDWLKVKCMQRQEFVVVGYTEPKGSRENFGALLLASRSESHGKLEFVGKVGTGFTRESLDDLYKRMRKLETKKSPIDEKIAEKNIHWIKPELVAEISFTGWSNDRILRHPSFAGLREDKPSREVQIESKKKLAEVATSTPQAETKTRLTSPDKVLFSGQGLTKQDLANYYESVAERMLPYILNRPLTLVRCPRGNEKVCFFQKHYQKGMGPGIAPVYVEEKTKNASHVSITSPEGLLSLVQMGVLEIHTWGARADDIERPDQIVFDFDPDPTTSWEEVVEGLHELRKYLEEIKLVPFLKLSGGKGAHIHIPIQREYTWEEVRSFSERVARKMEERIPETFTANPLKKERGGRLYLDYVRNNKGTTFVAPYSTRSKKDAPIAAPISWEELTAETRPGQFTVANFKERLERLKEDPWKNFEASAKRLPKKV